MSTTMLFTTQILKGLGATSIIVGISVFPMIVGKISELISIRNGSY